MWKTSEINEDQIYKYGQLVPASSTPGTWGRYLVFNLCLTKDKGIFKIFNVSREQRTSYSGSEIPTDIEVARWLINNPGYIGTWGYTLTEEGPDTCDIFGCDGEYLTKNSLLSHLETLDLESFTVEYGRIKLVNPVNYFNFNPESVITDLSSSMSEEWSDPEWLSNTLHLNNRYTLKFEESFLTWLISVGQIPLGYNLFDPICYP